ncbi:MAG TPA: hypothetical protein VLB76_13655 [Thermoanaerobaculia bacterium]|nr:hypothetical protein [Thermoanaerobaculia bacterium]
MSYRKIPARAALAVFLAASLGAFALWACGPFFPPWLLNDEAGILEAPTTWLRDALDPLLPPGKPAHLAIIDSDPYEQTSRIDEAELKAALEELDPTSSRRALLLEQYREIRRVLTGRAKSYPPHDSMGLVVPAGLPGEFDDYLRGAIAYHEDRFKDAREIWEKLLSRPVAERRHRTTWAAFMIGKASLKLSPDTAAPWFERTRELASQGFPDPLGLAAASFGWQAYAAIELKWPAEALTLYLRQLKAGDSTAVNSIRFSASKWIDDPVALRQIANSSEARAIFTAYVVQRWDRTDYDGPLDPDAARKWIAAVQAAGVPRTEGADRLAWAAYRAGDFAAAEAWAKQAPADAPMARWIRAKLLLRAGKVAEAEALLAQAAPALPAKADQDLWRAYENGVQSALRPRAAGELGAVRLARGEYVPALDALLRGGYWTDAAYVAERTLTVDELRAYVDRTFAAGLAARYNPDGTPAEQNDRWDLPYAGLATPPDERIAYDLRYLLGRRLARAGHLADARPYLPESRRAVLDDLARSLSRGRDAARPAAERSQALFRAACLTRYQGLELLGTEIEPDWFVHGGFYEQDPFAEARADPKTHRHLGPSPDERQRVARNHAIPDKRFHYRYGGMDLAREAAKLLPGGTEEKARLLATAGNWVEGMDAKGARPLYDAIQSCCANTEIGRRSRKVNAITNVEDACPADVRPKGEGD